jgi:hypothetical protein
LLALDLAKPVVDRRSGGQIRPAGRPTDLGRHRHGLV